MRIAVAGGGKIALSLLNPLLESRHEIVASIQNGRNRKGFSRRLAPTVERLMHGSKNVLAIAKMKKLAIVWIDTMSDTELDPLRAVKPDLILVGGFGIIFKKSILELPSIGCVNMHSSVLPHHRGPNPFSSVILANEPESGITFHIMEEGIDSGDIINQTSFSISNMDTALTVYNRCCSLAGECVLDVIDRIESDGLKGTPQNDGEASYYNQLTDEDAFIDWTDTAENIDRLVRGCHPFLPAHFQVNDVKYQVLRSSYNPAPVTELPGTILAMSPYPVIATGCGTITLIAGDHTAGVALRVQQGSRLE